MLVLSRKVNESVVIDLGNGRCVTVKVTGFGRDRDKVRLGIIAPREIPVHRNEIYDRIHHPKEVV